MVPELPRPPKKWVRPCERPIRPSKT
jgi:hypothetical protein